MNLVLKFGRVLSKRASALWHCNACRTQGKLKVLRDTRVRTEAVDASVIYGLLTKYTGHIFTALLGSYAQSNRFSAETAVSHNLTISPVQVEQFPWDFLVHTSEILRVFLRSAQIYDNKWFLVRPICSITVTAWLCV